jgi:hypothetical protein
MTTVGDSISRVRNVLKAVKEDPFLTDRFIYSIVMKHAKALIKRESDMANIFKYTSLFNEIPCLELIEVDRIEACCSGIRTGCTFKRSKYKLPSLFELNIGPVIKAVTSIDYSQDLVRTQPELYITLTKTSSFKYNKQKYYWVLNDYLYLPNADWDAVRIQAMFDESISAELCGLEQNNCVIEQERELTIPEHLFTEIEQLVVTEILTAGQIPSDGADDSQNVMR